MPTQQQKQEFVMHRMTREPKTVLDAVVANTTAQQRTAIFNTLVTMEATEEIAQIEAFIRKYIGGDPTLLAAAELRLAQLKG
jgi:hypothetical protein